MEEEVKSKDMKKYIVRTYTYDKDLHRDIISDYEDFDKREDAIKYFDSREPNNNSTIEIRGNWGYEFINQK